LKNSRIPGFLFLAMEKLLAMQHANSAQATRSDMSHAAPCSSARELPIEASANFGIKSSRLEGPQEAAAKPTPHGFGEAGNGVSHRACSTQVFKFLLRQQSDAKCRQTRASDFGEAGLMLAACKSRRTA
jgi:hypothetical protein